MNQTSEALASPEALEALAARLADLDLPAKASGLPLGDKRDRLIGTIKNYLLPRVAGVSRPLTVVFAGPTGAGKSTLINSIVERDLSDTGPLRPTTSTPHVYAAQDLSDEYQGLGGIECEVVGGEAPVLKTMTLVDTPDIDSTAVEHRMMAERLIDVADIVVFVSSALRYADAIPWEVLRRAKARGAPVICVLNRVRYTSDGAADDYRRTLASEGVGESVVVVSEHHLHGGSRVPSGSVRSLRQALVTQIELHNIDISATTRRVLDSTCHEADRLIRDLRDELARSLGPIVDLTKPVLPLLEEYGEGPLPVAEIASLAKRSRWRARRMARQVARNQDLLEVERARLADAIVFQLDKWANQARGGLNGKGLEEIRLTVSAWLGDGTEPVAGARWKLASLADLLLRVLAASTASWPTSLLNVVSREADFFAEVDSLRRDMDERIAEVMSPSLAFDRDERTIIDKTDLAAEALSDVIVSVTFADA